MNLLSWFRRKPAAEALSSALADGKRVAQQDRVFRQIEALAEDELEMRRALGEMARDLARTIRDLATRRKLIELSMKVIDEAHSAPPTIISFSMSVILYEMEPPTRS